MLHQKRLRAERREQRRVYRCARKLIAAHAVRVLVPAAASIWPKNFAQTVTGSLDHPFFSYQDSVLVDETDRASGDLALSQGAARRMRARLQMPSLYAALFVGLPRVDRKGPFLSFRARARERRNVQLERVYAGPRRQRAHGISRSARGGCGRGALADHGAACGKMRACRALAPRPSASSGETCSG